MSDQEERPQIGPPDKEFGPGYPPQGPLHPEPELRSEADIPGPLELPEQMQREIASGFGPDGFPNDPAAREVLEAVRQDARYAALLFRLRLGDLSDEEYEELRELSRTRHATVPGALEEP